MFAFKVIDIVMHLNCYKTLELINECVTGKETSLKMGLATSETN